MQLLLSESPSPLRDFRSVALMVGSGLINTTIAAWIACPQPIHSGASLWRILWTSLLYVTVSLGFGIALTWGFWRLFRTEFLVGFAELCLSAGPVWLLVPPTVFLIRGDSAWSIPLVLLIGWMSAARIRRLATLEPVEVPGPIPSVSPFALLPAPSREIWFAVATSICAEGALVAIARSQLSGSGLLLGTAAFLVQWQTLKFRGRKPAQTGSGQQNLTRLSSSYLLMVLLMLWVLALTRDRRHLSIGPRQGLANSASVARKPNGANAKPSRLGDGYKGILLWTVPEKKKLVDIIAPRLRTGTQATDRRPVVIPFDGPYWYFQTPQRGIGKEPHIAHGDPVKVNIRSLDWLPLMMEAHESIGSSIDLACCSEVQMHVRNGDNHPGSVLLGIVLTDSTVPGKPSLSLGGMPVLSTLPEHFALKTSAVEDTLHYPIPPTARIKKFNEITVVFFPSSDHAQEGVKIGVQDFVLIPR